VKKKLPANIDTIKVALVDDVPLAIEGWKRSLKNEVDIEIALETTPNKLSEIRKYPLPVEIILVGAWWLATKAGREWLRTLKGLNYRPKVIAIATTEIEIRNAQKAGVDEAALSPIKRGDLVSLVRGLSRDDKRVSEFYANRLLEIRQAKGNNTSYEDLIYSILQLLFDSDLINPKYVDRDIGVRDLIFLNLGKHRFWMEIKTRYGVDYLIFFLGNKNANFVSSELDELGKYLDGPFGRFGILFTRNDAGKNACNLQLAIYKNYQKIILIMNEVHLREMLALKAARMDPLEVLQDLYEEIIGSSMHVK